GDEDRVLGNSGGFVRGHVESPPGTNHHGAGRYHDEVESYSASESSFNRGAVEGVPNGNLGKPTDYESAPYNAPGDKKVVC
ncbi:unnamed protein product, partial [Allacma fusca]